jgi:hypothetical protein
MVETKVKTNAEFIAHWRAQNVSEDWGGEDWGEIGGDFMDALDRLEAADARIAELEQTLADLARVEVRKSAVLTPEMLQETKRRIEHYNPKVNQAASDMLRSNCEAIAELEALAVKDKDRIAELESREPSVPVSVLEEEVRQLNMVVQLGNDNSSWFCRGIDSARERLQKLIDEAKKRG